MDITFGNKVAFGISENNFFVDVFIDGENVGFVSTTKDGPWTSSTSLQTHTNDTRFVSDSLEGIKKEIFLFFA